MVSAGASEPMPGSGGAARRVSRGDLRASNQHRELGVMSVHAQLELRPMPRLDVHGVDISHARLVDLTMLADQAYAFYEWIERAARTELRTTDSLDEILRSRSEAELQRAILACYRAPVTGRAVLLDGGGRNYRHEKACYFFFAWAIRDAPQQRLAPLVNRVVRSSKVTRVQAEAEVLARLFVTYRDNVRTFGWSSMREVVIDRLEGSRRSIRGHAKEVVVRTAVASAVQQFYTVNGNYGRYATVDIPEGQIKIGTQTFDVSVSLTGATGVTRRRILMPIKTRETEGGGHAHLFTRDVQAALEAVRSINADDYVAAVIVAANWAPREIESVKAEVDHAVILDMNPNEFERLSDVEQVRLQDFVASVLRGEVEPKATTRGT